MSSASGFSWRRLAALCRKESLQIFRDPSSMLIAFILPIILLAIFGYGVNLDSDRIRIGIFSEDAGPDAALFVAALNASPHFEPRRADSRQTLQRWLTDGRIRGFVVLQSDFGARLLRPGDAAPIEVIADGAEPNTAVLAASKLQGAWQSWVEQRALDRASHSTSLIEVVPRYWFNQAAISRNFIVPGSIAVIMTIIGSLLTSLVVAREWERGTMEALLSTPITRSEFLLSKMLPYFVLAMASMLLCVAVAVLFLKVPFRGSLLLLVLYTSCYLGNALGLGLLLSTLTRNQYNAAQAAINAAFLPAFILSGLFYEIASMPAVIRAVTYLVPARYFVSALETLFQAGFVGSVLFRDLIFLILSAFLLLGLTAWRTRRRLE